MLDSVRARLTFWYAGTLAFALIAAFTVGYVLFSRSLQRRVDHSLRSSASALSALMTEERLEGEHLREAAESTVRESGLPERAVTILDGNGSVLASRPGTLVGQAPQAPESQAPDARSRFTTEDGDAVERAVQRGVAHDGEGYTIVVAVSLQPLREDLALFRRAAFLTVPAAAILAALGGWILTGRTLAPVVSMCAEARKIGDSDLDRRLPVLNPRDELGMLAVTFNDLMARLQASFTRQREFVADASHELRTPLSIVRSTATLTLDRSTREEHEYRTALQVVADESRRLSRLVDDMLTLARADAGYYPLRAARLCLAEMLRDVAQAGSVLGAPRSIRVSFSFAGEAPFTGDEELLRRMVLNLVENAQTHSPAGSTVIVSLDTGEGRWRIRVRDEGPGIPSAEQARVFDRFYRGEGGAPGGAGLGLAIARWIAEKHGGELRIENSAPGGTTVLASLPAQENAILAS
jgi:two-component system, OmpR family, sensor kinase